MPWSCRAATLSWSCRTYTEDLCFSSCHLLQRVFSLSLWSCSCSQEIKTTFWKNRTEETRKTQVNHFWEWSYWGYKPKEEIFEGSAHGEAGAADLYSLQHPRIPQLVEDHLRVENIWILQAECKWLCDTKAVRYLWNWVDVLDRYLFHVGLYAANEERVGNTQGGHKSMKRILKQMFFINSFVFLNYKPRDSFSNLYLLLWPSSDFSLFFKFKFEEPRYGWWLCISTLCNITKDLFTELGTGEKKNSVNSPHLGWVHWQDRDTY